ncbi:MAG: hypothetical protein ACYC9J_10600 [Sulfuricaulis sp.]
MKKMLFSLLLPTLTLVAVSAACAQDMILDDVETSVEPDWARIVIHFAMPVNYISHSPQEHGQLLQIFFSIAGVDAQNISLREEVRNITATPVLPATTITYDPPLSLNLQRDPSTLLVRFDHAVNFDVRPGDDQRSIAIYIPIAPVETRPVDPNRKKSEKTDSPTE